MEGFEDPFNRQTYPWGREDPNLRAWFGALGRLRRDHPALRRGDLRFVAAQGPLLAFTRSVEEETVLFLCNAGDTPERLTLDLPAPPPPPLGDIPWEETDDGVVFALGARSAGALGVSVELGVRS